MLVPALMLRRSHPTGRHPLNLILQCSCEKGGCASMPRPRDPPQPPALLLHPFPQKQGTDVRKRFAEVPFRNLAFCTNTSRSVTPTKLSPPGSLTRYYEGLLCFETVMV